MTPSVWDRRWTRLRATALGWKPVAAMAASTAARVRGETSGRLLMTRETVWVETPHMRAISLIVMRLMVLQWSVPKRVRRLASSPLGCYGTVIVNVSGNDNGTSDRIHKCRARRTWTTRRRERRRRV